MKCAKPIALSCLISLIALAGLPQEFWVETALNNLDIQKGPYHLLLDEVKIKASSQQTKISFRKAILITPVNLPLEEGKFYLSQKKGCYYLAGSVLWQSTPMKVNLELNDSFLRFELRVNEVIVKGNADLSGSEIKGEIILPFDNVISFIYRGQKPLFYLGLKKINCQGLSFYFSGRTQCAGRLKGGVLGIYEKGRWCVEGQIILEGSWINLSLLNRWMHLSIRKPYSTVTVNRASLLLKGIFPIFRCRLYLLSPVGKFYSQWVASWRLHDILKAEERRGDYESS